MLCDDTFVTSTQIAVCMTQKIKHCLIAHTILTKLRNLYDLRVFCLLNDHNVNVTVMLNIPIKDDCFNQNQYPCYHILWWFSFMICNLALQMTSLNFIQSISRSSVSILKWTIAIEHAYKLLTIHCVPSVFF